MSETDSLLRLQTIGRKSGKPHSVLLRFITNNGRIIVFPERASHQDWVLNLAVNPEVTAHAKGKRIGGVASLKRASGIDDPILSIFQRKYGSRIVRERYWGQMEYVEINPVNQDAGDLIELTYADLEVAFDGVAEDYDRHIFGNPVNVWLRNRSVGLMSRIFKRGDVVLEIGCGTGTETMSLARMGIKVIATDISSKMLEVLRRHASDAGVTDYVVPVQSRPYLLYEKLTAIGYPLVDGAYSTYGAINTDPRVEDFFANLHSLLKPGGKLILGVWNKYCLYEILGYALKANPSLAVARFRNPVPVGKSRFCVSTNAYSVGSLSKTIAGMFTLEEVYGVGVLIPPSNLLRYLPPEPMLSIAKGFELRFGGSFPWNRLGDHFLGVYSRAN